MRGRWRRGLELRLVVHHGAAGVASGIIPMCRGLGRHIGSSLLALEDGFDPRCERAHLVVVRGPLLHDPPGALKLRLLRHGVVAQVDGFRRRFGFVPAPGFAPQPFPREREDRDLVLGIVGEILVQVCEAVGILREAVVDDAELIPRGGLPETLEVDHIQGTDVVRLPAKMGLPEAALPETVPVHVFVVVAERRVRVRGAVEVHLDELAHVCPDNLIRVHENHLLQVEGEKDVKEENFVRPDYPLLLCLFVQPARPLVGHELVLESVRLGKVREESLHLRAHVVFDEPELDRRSGVPKNAKDHDLLQPLVHVP
mmetsp:Transcript_39866/g.94693  ORF Transcript_39866/g.94693 Transcript_39866/m.94693 type:complete len:313 (+) Transcript_39866:47-985(+)